ncbi:MAG: BspA family leucine-rich repeat surface protein [Prevotella sp.]|nr:BspA family leucine-rich repeat surface protein [Prevotella sp.]
MKDSVNRIILVLACLLTMGLDNLLANPITAEEAMQKAMSVLNSGQMRRVRGNRQLTLAYTLDDSSKSDRPLLYAFNISDDNGFIIASGDDRAEPILGYCEQGKFNPDSIPVNMKEWMDGLAQEIAWAQSNGYESVTSSTPSKAKSTINYLIKSTWGQNNPFNNQCAFNGKICVAGCVAIAMAQVMYYWASVGKNGQYFRGGSKALSAYTTKTMGYSVAAQSALSSFSWTSMTNEQPTTSASKQAVAQLVRYCGQSVQMDYTESVSIASLTKISPALKEYFGYNYGIKTVSASSMTTTQWNDLVYQELAAGRPVIMSGVSSSGSGHAFICDGYNASNSKYHFNWGWAGYCDGWFAMNALLADGVYYNDSKNMVYNIDPFDTSAYALLSSDATTLSFYYDTKRSSRSGTIYELNTGQTAPGWSSKKTIKKVVFDSSFASYSPTSTYSWFLEQSALTTLTGLANLNTSQTTNMARMFKGCTALKAIDLSKFSTSKVTTMAEMFYGCTGLTSLDLTPLNMSAVTNTTSMASGCTAVKTVSLPSTTPTDLNTYAFNNIGTSTAPCKITAPSGFDFGVNTAAVSFKWKSGYFYLSGAKAPYAYMEGTQINFCYDANAWTHSSTPYPLNTGTTNPGWYGQDENITTVVFNSTFASVRPTSTYRWFSGMSNLTKITGLSYLNTSEVTNITAMFYECGKLTEIDLSTMDFSKVTSSSYLMSNCTSLTKLTIPASASGLYTNAFSGVGTTSAPCIITAPSGFNFDTDTSKLTFKWKGGVFYLTGTKTPYAILSGNQLTFYYDATAWSRGTTFYALNSGTTNPGWYGQVEEVTTVVFNSAFASARPTSTYRWFAGMSNLTKITGLTYLNTSEVTNMNYMFYNCSALTSIDLSKFNTAQTTSMAYMFSGCKSVKSLDLSKLNTANVTSLNYMFNGCSALTSLDMSSWDMGKVTACSYMAKDCSQVTSVSIPATMPDLSAASFYGIGSASSPCIMNAPASYDFGISTNGLYFKWNNGVFFLKGSKTAYAYVSDNQLTFCYDAEPWSHGSPITLNSGSTKPGWIAENANITTVVFNSTFASVRPTSTYQWFYGMSNLTKITGLTYLNTSEVTNMQSMFNKCSALTSIDLSKFNTAKTTNMSYMFYNCEALTALNLSTFNTANVTTMLDMFYGCKLVKSLDLSTFNTSNVTTMEQMFYNCSALTSLDLSHFDMSNVTTMTYLMGYCSNLKSISIPSSMPATNSYAFYNIGSASAPCILTAPASYNFETSTDGLYFKWQGGVLFLKGSKTSYAYIDGTQLNFCYDADPWAHGSDPYPMNTGSTAPKWSTNNANITSVVFNSSFAAARPTSTYMWFSDMAQITKITGLNYLNTEEVTIMGKMFYNCSALTSIDLSNITTLNATSTNSMFYGCSALKKLDVSKFDTSNATNLGYMFSGCTSLGTIDVSNMEINPSATTSYMFRNCTSLTSVQLHNSFSFIDANAFYGVGLSTAPCIITSADGCNFDTEVTQLYFKWKSGYFFLSETRVPYAYINGTEFILTFDDQPWTHNTTVYKMNSGTTSPVWKTQVSTIKSASIDESFADYYPVSTYQWFYGMSEMTEIKGLEYINMQEAENSNQMFMGCSSLKSISLPSNFSSIGLNMFRECTSLESVEIPSSVTSIGNYAFYGCSNLTSVTVDITMPLEITTYVFSNRKNADLHIPAGYKSLYAQAAYWKEFKNMFEFGFAIGDANHDGRVNVADVMCVVNHILGKDDINCFVAQSDVNHDNIVNVTDIMEILRLVLYNSPNDPANNRNNN